VSGIVDIVGIARIKQLAAFDDAAWGEQLTRSCAMPPDPQIGAAALREARRHDHLRGLDAGLRAVREQVPMALPRRPASPRAQAAQSWRAIGFA